MKQPFAEIALEERVWSTQHSWGTIIQLFSTEQVFFVRFDDPKQTKDFAYYTSGIRKYGEHTQERTLFWEAQPMKEQFKDIKINDRVWSVNYGWGDVWAVEKHKFQVCFPNHAIKWYLPHGMEMRGPKVSQTLFWDEIHITPPPRPAAPIIHTIEQWSNVYFDGNSRGYASKQQADSGKCDSNKRIACVKLTGTYTTWEEGS